ncbi:hypothetical protein OHA71_42765 [Streptomyces sp. NBC_00444]|uniref:hypothetical protein n=1 Tax=Streptomyces sp. NBC_00444 TaxID=2975744 RepID=UPI002E1FDCB1
MRIIEGEDGLAEGSFRGFGIGPVQAAWHVQEFVGMPDVYAKGVVKDEVPQH